MFLEYFVYVTQQLTLARGAPEPIFKVPAETGSGWNWKKVRAGTRTDSLKVPYSPYVNKAFVYIFVSKILSFIRQLFIFSSF
jgi:hypothetical protein